MKLNLAIYNLSKKHIMSGTYLYTFPKLFSSKNFSSHRKKIQDFFFDKQVQSILMRITNLEYDKIFQNKNKNMLAPKYKFVTDKKLKELQDIAASKAVEKLQMPPVMEIREPVDEVLSKDPELQGFLEYKLIFTDISPGVSSRDRIITVRELDGTLRKASWDERSHVNQIFFPLPGRNLETPKLFERPYLDRLLEEESYIFVLDSACIQFEPDDPEYHRVTHATYDHVKLRKKFDILRSTRHFGPMAFYFAYKKVIDPLLVDMIERELISDAFHTIRLLYILNSELKLSENIDEANELEFIQDYINMNSSSEKASLELAFQTYIEKQTSIKKEESVN